MVHSSTIEQNKILIRRVYQDTFVDWNISPIDKWVSLDFVGHEMPSGTPAGPEGFRRFYARLRAALPDLTYSAQDIIAEDDKVVVR